MSEDATLCRNPPCDSSSYVHMVHSKNTFPVPPTRSDVAACVSQARASYLRRSFSLSQGYLSQIMHTAPSDHTCYQPFGEKVYYLREQFTLGAVLAHQEGVRLVGLHSALGKLRDFELVRVAHRRRDVNLVRRIRNVLIVELDSHPVFT